MVDVPTFLASLPKTGGLRPELQLQEHQKRVVEKTKRLPRDGGLLVYHGLGSGKTLASIAAGEALGGRVEAVVPAALRENYRKEILKGVDDPAHFDVKSYQSAVRDGFDPDTKLTVFDESQRLGREGTLQSELATQAPGRKMLLSGTPIRNEPSELTPLLRAIAPDRDVPATADDFNERFLEPEHANGWLKRLFGARAVEPAGIKNQDELAELLKDRVDYHASVGDFPTTKEEDIDVEMSSDQTDLYQGLAKRYPGLMWKMRNQLPASKTEEQQMDAFLSASRQVSNTPSSFWSEQTDPVDSSPKLQRMLKEIVKRSRKDPNFRSLTYSNYLDSGVEPLAERLNASGVSAGVFSGKMNDQERKDLIERYNTGKLKSLLISGAGAEGLDLKGTRLVQLMEPYWNEARSDQVIGRAVRNQSHAALPADQRDVHIQRYFSHPKPGLLERIGWNEPDPGADRYLAGRARRKQELNEQFLQVLRQVGSPQQA